MVETITTTKLRCLGIIGHSNGCGLAGVNEMIAAAPRLFFRKEPVLTDARESYWKDIFVFTSAHGYASPAGTPPTHTIDEGAWLELTVNNPASPADAHPHASPYAYPNNTGLPLPNYGYDAVLSNPSINRGTGTFVGIEIPLLWRLSHYWCDQIGMVKLSVPGSYFLRYDLGINARFIFDPYSYINSPTATRPASTVDSSFGYYDWYTPSESFDWAPNTGRLYKKWIDKNLAAKAALPTGTTMSMDVVICWMGDNDCRFEHGRVQYWKDDVRKFVKRLRQDLVDNGLTTLPAEEVRIIWMGVCSYYNTAVENQHLFLNAAVQEVVADDPYMRYVPVDDLAVHSADPGHYTAQGYLDAESEVFEAIKDMDVDPYAALNTDELLTVDQMRDRVRLHYNRGTVQTDAKDEIVLLHLNGAMHHLVHQCGDMAYWLVNREELDIDVDVAGQPTTMPRYVHRVLNIEDPYDSTYPLLFEHVGHTEGGKVQIALKEQITGTYQVSYIRLPRDLTRPEQLVPIPPPLTEWLIAECCLRMARASSNPLQMAGWQAECNRLHVDVLKNLGQTMRAKRDRIMPVRRLPNIMPRRNGRR